MGGIVGLLAIIAAILLFLGFKTIGLMLIVGLISKLFSGGNSKKE